MKSKLKKRASIIIVLGIFFAISSIYYSNPFLKTVYKEKSTVYRDYFTLDRANLKISAVSGKIHIDNNWTAAKAAGICTGDGTYSDPYVIEDLVIDGENSGSCILIENSDVFFKIENCTVYNSGTVSYMLFYAGIRLSHVNNSNIIDNDSSDNWYGIHIEYSDNNTISGNTANFDRYGILLVESNNNNISGNTASYGGSLGIHLYNSSGNTVSGNIMNHCGLGLFGSLEKISSNDIDTTNLVNGKPLYYYTNEVHLGPDDFTNAGQVILVNCNDSLISNLDISQSTNAISFHYCNNNTVSGNTANHVRNAIRLSNSDNNLVSGNTANYGSYGIHIYESNNNNVSGNTVSYNNIYGINLYDSNNNNVSGNTADFNDEGISLYYSSGNNISGNTASNNTRYGISLRGSDYNDITGNTANYNDDKKYVNKYNSYGIYLSESDYNDITENIANNNTNFGIYLRYSDYNAISGNTANNNSYGIYLTYSDYNDITGNTLIGNDKCIFEVNCTGNKFSDNGDCHYGEVGEIPFELIILISVISGGVVIGVATLLLIRRKRRSIQ